MVGGALGELALGKRIGNKAVVIGAMANTIPDLDVFFIKLANSPDIALRIHRSYTHALFIHPFMALPLAFLLYRIFKKEISFVHWYIFFVISFVTHALMDCCTTYGTQLFLPFTNTLISWNNLSVVDPLFTLPCILFFLAVFFFKKNNEWRRRFAVLGICMSLFYLTTSTINKFNSAKVFRHVLTEKHITYSDFSTTPTMFTSWLWNMIAYNDTTMYLAEYSVFQKTKKIDVVEIKRNTILLNPIKNTKAIQTLLWFSQGNYFVEKNASGTLNFYNTKWGRGDFTSMKMKEMFPFYDRTYREKDGNITFKEVFPDFTKKDFITYFSMLRKRIFD